MAQIAFRDLPGIAFIESQLALAGLMKDEIEALDRAIHDASERLFGIQAHETTYDMLPEEARPSTAEEWDRHFEFLYWEYEEEDTFWEAIGLDVTDGDGEELLSMDVFGRQLVCAVKGIHPRATANFLTGEKSPAQLEAEAQAWLRNLMAKDR